MIFESERDFAGIIVDFRWVYVNPAAEKSSDGRAMICSGKRMLEEVREMRRSDFSPSTSKSSKAAVFFKANSIRAQRAQSFSTVTAVKGRRRFRRRIQRRDANAEKRKSDFGRLARGSNRRSPLPKSDWTWDCVNDVVTADKNLARCFPSTKRSERLPD
jgi:hypothetical protein